MKRFLLIALLAATSSICAQERSEAEAKRAEAEQEKPIWGLPKITWTTINFAILALGLGYMIGKAAPPFFRDRTTGIQGAIREASTTREYAEARAIEIEEKISQLGAEIERLRAESKTEMEAEANRTREKAGRALAKVQEHAEQEIVSAAKHARQELKAYSGQLALELAEARIKTQMNPQTQDSLVRGFVDDLAQHRVSRESR